MIGAKQNVQNTPLSHMQKKSVGSADLDHNVTQHAVADRIELGL